MKIEVLYFDGCPNHNAAVERVRDVLKEQGISAQVSQVNVPDDAAAQAVGFMGSPSIRVNGLDVEPAARLAREHGMMCRTYLMGGRREGLPSREMIRQGLHEAQTGVSTADPRCQPVQANARAGQKSTSAPLLMAGSVAAAIVASFCCILPIVFALTGFSILGALALFAAWRPYLLALTFGLLGVGFYFAYRPRVADCAPGFTCALPSTRQSGRLSLWLVTAAVILFAAFPYYSGVVADVLLSGSSLVAVGRKVQVPAVAHATFVV
ncbi:MAG: DF family (seleno)protein, partial [Gammaproteobacteria bacterium]